MPDDAENGDDPVGFGQASPCLMHGEACGRNSRPITGRRSSPKAAPLSAIG